MEIYVVRREIVPGVTMILGCFADRTKALALKAEFEENDRRFRGNDKVRWHPIDVFDSNTGMHSHGLPEGK